MYPRRRRFANFEKRFRRQFAVTTVTRAGLFGAASRQSVSLLQGKDAPDQFWHGFCFQKRCDRKRGSESGNKSSDPACRVRTAEPPGALESGAPGRQRTGMAGRWGRRKKLINDVTIKNINKQPCSLMRGRQSRPKHWRAGLPASSGPAQQAPGARG